MFLCMYTVCGLSIKWQMKILSHFVVTVGLEWKDGLALLAHKSAKNSSLGENPRTNK